MNIQWYPGHMTKTRRMIGENLKFVDAICEIIDARIPVSSRNPDLDSLTSGKPRLIILNRVDLADPNINKSWADYFKNQGNAVMETNSKSGAGVGKFSALLRQLLYEKLTAYEQKGQVGRTLKVMICGIPNVGKSTFINRVAGKNAARAEDRPGVTRGKQWIHVDAGIDLMDTPGILWPRFDDKLTGLNLAFTGAVKEDILDVETLAAYLFEALSTRYSKELTERYKIKIGSKDGGFKLLEQAGKARGFLLPGGEVNIERMSKTLLDEFRAGKLARISLETVSDIGREPLKQLSLRGNDGMITEELL